MTDRHAARGTLAHTVERACRGGVTAVMLREKDLSTPDLVSLGRDVAAVCRDAGVTFLVNSDVDAASQLGADGVHLGYRSVPVARARELLGNGILVGRSTHDREELETAVLEDGADYVTFGPIFDTPKKRGLIEPRGVEGLRAAVGWAQGTPVVALGGLAPDSAEAVRAAGAAGVAAIRALVAAADPQAAAAAFLTSWGTSA